MSDCQYEQSWYVQHSQLVEITTICGSLAASAACSHDWYYFYLQGRRTASTLPLNNCMCRLGLFDGLRDGYALLRVIDQLSPGTVDWRGVRKPPLKPLLRRVHSIENCNQVSQQGTGDAVQWRSCHART